MDETMYMLINRDTSDNIFNIKNDSHIFIKDDVLEYLRENDFDSYLKVFKHIEDTDRIIVFENENFKTVVINISNLEKISLDDEIKNDNILCYISPLIREYRLGKLLK